METDGHRLKRRRIGEVSSGVGVPREADARKPASGRDSPRCCTDRISANAVMELDQYHHAPAETRVDHKIICYGMVTEALKLMR